MIYYIIIETSSLNGRAIHRTLGYTTSKVYAETLCLSYIDMYNWIEENIIDLRSGEKDLDDFFSIHSPICQVGCESDCIEGMGLIELTE